MKNRVMLCALMALAGVPGVATAAPRAAMRPIHAATSLPDGTDCSNVVQRLPALRLQRVALETLANRADAKNGRLGLKDEFETDAAYQARLDSIWSKPLDANGRLVVVLDTPPFDTAFDADTGKINIANIAVPDYDHDLPNGKKPFFQIGVASALDAKTYRAANAFGVNAVVHSLTGTQVSLITNDLASQGILEKGSYGYGLHFAASVSDARLFKRNGKLIVVARGATPLTYYRRRKLAATLDDPIETVTSNFGLHTHVECIVAVAGSKELARFP